MKLIDENAAHPELAAQDMHGPVEVHITVYAKHSEGQVGRMTFTHPAGLIPTQAELVSLVEVARQEAAKQEATLPTKAEFVAHITRRETGKSIPMAGSQEWVGAVPFPRDMLVHAVMGAGFGENGGAHYEQTTPLAYENEKGGYEWDWLELNCLSAPDLLDLYSEITAEVSNG